MLNSLLIALFVLGFAVTVNADVVLTKHDATQARIVTTIEELKTADALAQEVDTLKRERQIVVFTKARHNADWDSYVAKLDAQIAEKEKLVADAKKVGLEVTAVKAVAVQEEEVLEP